MAKIDLSSFKVNNSLHPDVWTNEKLKPAIRKVLLKNAAVFMKELEITKDQIEDITLTGSMANFNWTKSSDLDLHLLLDYKKVQN